MRWIDFSFIVLLAFSVIVCLATKEYIGASYALLALSITLSSMKTNR